MTFPGRRISVCLIALLPAAVWTVIELAAYNVDLSFASLARALGFGAVGVAVLLAIGYWVAPFIGIVRIDAGSNREHPLSIAVLCFLGLLVASAFFAPIDASRNEYAADSSCRTKLTAPLTGTGSCTIEAVRLVGAKVAPTRRRSYLILVRSADGTTNWVDLGPTDNRLWRDVIANSDLPAFAQRFHGEIVRIDSARTWHETVAIAYARMADVFEIAFVLYAFGMVAVGAALRETVAST